ncbi:MAG: hypothetical protein QOJ00_38 [Actinomycetota bacterium]|jgi:hypothetical protein
MDAPAAEIRVHGVGGSSPASILGLGSDVEAELVTFGDRTGVWRRRSQPEIEGYVWGGLTSGSSLQPFWILLLPFTLVNVAGWMHEPAAVLGLARIRVIRAVTFCVGLTMTATYAVWTALIIEDSIGSRWLPRRHPHLGGHHITPRWGTIVGGVAMLVMLSLLTWLAHGARRAERRVENSNGVSVTSTRGNALLGVGARTEETLDDVGFFNRASDSGRLLAVHVVWSFALVVALTAFAYAAAAGTVLAKNADPPAYLRSFFNVIGGTQAALLLVLIAASAVPERKRTGFRWCAPAIACGLSIMIANGMFAGFSRLVDSRLNTGAPTRFLYPDLVPITLAIAFVATAAWAIRNRIAPVEMDTVGPTSDEPVPENTADLGEPRNGATRSARTLTARFRAIAHGVARIDVVLTQIVVGFGVVVLAFGYMRVRYGADRWRWQPGAVAGTEIIAVSGVALVAVLWLKRKDPKTRKTVGIVWDLLTFWPRRFHPFAVRPFSEQAVPELRGRIVALQHEYGRVLVSCHSQGTVLSFAAIAPLVTGDAFPEKTISLVTYGSPLGGLFRVFFPAYFSDDEMRRVHSRLRTWRNFRRLTDPIGNDIHSVDTVVLASPGVTPAAGAGLRVPATVAERDRPPWAKVEVHSYYRNEPRMKEVIDDLRYQ